MSYKIIKRMDQTLSDRAIRLEQLCDRVKDNPDYVRWGLLIEANLNRLNFSHSPIDVMLSIVKSYMAVKRDHVIIKKGDKLIFEDVGITALVHVPTKKYVRNKGIIYKTIVDDLSLSNRLRWSGLDEKPDLSHAESIMSMINDGDFKPFDYPFYERFKQARDEPNRINLVLEMNDTGNKIIHIYKKELFLYICAFCHDFLAMDDNGTVKLCFQCKASFTNFWVAIDPKAYNDFVSLEN